MRIYVGCMVLLALLIAGSLLKPAKYELKDAFPNVKIQQPVEFAQPNDGTNRIFVLAQKGIIHVFSNEGSATQSTEFLNISKQVVSGGERGLLGLAFHPDFKNNGYFYVNYTRGKPLETAISRFKVSTTNPNVADPASEVVLLTYAQPYSNHNGGKIAFGKDGYLYISAGDGGSGGDPQGNGQNRKQLLGKMIRIDVDTAANGLNYGIPSDNPYKGDKEGFREEIYAYGLRNAWKFSFDETTGKLWAGDVGQNDREEVSIIERGGNYGWKIMEGSVCFVKENPANNCDIKGLIKPVWEYLHSAGYGKSITGGFVYRGKQIPSLQGKYIYGDYQTGMIWALGTKEDGTYENELLMDSDEMIASFGETLDKELYVCSYATGKISKLTGSR